MTSIDRAGIRFSELLPGSSAPRWKTPIVSIKDETFDFIQRIEDCFSHGFFESNFWHIFTSMFAFQKWSSLVEMKRYMERFIHLVPGLQKLEGVMRT